MPAEENQEPPLTSSGYTRARALWIVIGILIVLAVIAILLLIWLFHILGDKNELQLEAAKSLYEFIGVLLFGTAVSFLIKYLAGSTGRCNTGLQFTGRRFKAQSLSRALIEAQSYLVEIGLSVTGQVGFLREVLS